MLILWKIEILFILVNFDATHFFSAVAVRKTSNGFEVRIQNSLGKVIEFSCCSIFTLEIVMKKFFFGFSKIGSDYTIENVPKNYYMKFKVTMFSKFWEKYNRKTSMFELFPTFKSNKMQMNRNREFSRFGFRIKLPSFSIKRKRIEKA